MCFGCLCALQKKIPNTSLNRLKFLKDLGSALVKPAIKDRTNPPRTGIPLSVQAAMASVIGPLPQQAHQAMIANLGRGKRNLCALCPRSKDTKYSAKCSTCSAFLCPEHTESNITTCVNCSG